VTARIVVAGNLSLDDTVSPTGTYAAAPGGDALYASLGARAWGLTPILLTLVGDDYPAAYLARVAAAGVDVSHIRTTHGPTVHYRVTNRADGTRQYDWISSEDRLLRTSPEAVDFGTASGGPLAGAAWLHVAEMPIEAQEVAVAAGRAAGVQVSLDPHEEYVVGFEQRLAAIVEGAAFMPSELEVRLLFPDIDAADGLGFGFAAAERLDALRPALLAIKLGALGSVVRWRGRSVHVPAPVVPVVDSTGAGDAYCGGFIAGWLATGSPEVAAACGTVAARETIGAFGAFPAGDPPTAIERCERVEALLGDAGLMGFETAFAKLRDQVGVATPA
jgi:sugar/nucleoside kinase (ribokinase family)